MDKKTKIGNLYKQGYSLKAIMDKLGVDTGYTLRVISDIENEKKRGHTNIAKAKENKRVEMERIQKTLRDLIPYENEQAKIEFKKLEKDLSLMRTEYYYLEKLK